MRADTQAEQADLLEDLRELAGCEFLSNLHERAWQRLLGQRLYRLDPARYSVRAWNRAVAYILDEPAQFQSARGAYSFLQHALAEK